MAADRRVGGIGQAELDDRGAAALRQFVRPGERQEAVHDQALDLVAAQFDRPRAADEPRPCAQQRDRDLVGSIHRQQLLLRYPAALHQLREAGGGQALARRATAGVEALLDQVGERQVHVVAAQHQVVADADAGQARRAAAVRGGLDLDQREVGGAAADVAHQHQARSGKLIRKTVAMAEQPVVEGGLRLLEQAQAG